MQAEPFTADLFGSVETNVGRLTALADAYRRDPEVRELAETNPHAALEAGDFEAPVGYDVRIVVNTDELFHVVFPPDPNILLADEDLMMVAGGKSASSAGSAGSVGTLSSIASTAGTASSAGSVSSAGSAS